MLVGLVLLAATLALRGATARNRHVHGRLLLSATVFGAYAALALIARYGQLADDTRRHIDAFQPLLLSFGVINVLVISALNPWREDRLPDRFPHIVQDSLVVLLFAIAASLILRDRLWATTAAGAVVLGLALQDTLGNLIAGLAIQIEKPFRVGDWVSLGGEEGVVSEITWRATKIRTRAGNFVIVPNNVLAKDRIVNYSEPTPHTRIEVEVGASYDTPPNDVKEAILDAIRHEPLLARDREPEVLVSDFSDSAIKYRIWVWTMDFGADLRLKDRVRTAVYYAFRRRGISIPYPIHVEMHRDWTEPAHHRLPRHALDHVQIFAPLTADQRAELLETARAHLYGVGETIVREGEPGSSMFVIARGEAAVTVASRPGPVARLHHGDFFGEMSLLTGDPRTATVSADTDCEVVEITADGFRSFVLAEPAVADQICVAVASRRAELEQHRAGAPGTAGAAADQPLSLAARMRRFLRLSS